MVVRLKVVAVAALAATSLAGCGLGSSSSGNSGKAQKSVAVKGKVTGTITFQTWSLKNDKFTPYFTKLISAYEKKHPGAHIKWVDQPADKYEDKVSSQVRGNSLPDVVNLPPDIAYQAARQGALLNLAKSDPKLRTDYVNSALDTYTYQDMTGTFAFPWYLGTDVDYWNKDILTAAGVDTKKLPSNLDELIAAAQKVHAKFGKSKYLVNQIPNFANFVSAGIKLTNDDGSKFVFNTPAAVKIVNKYVSAYKQGLIPDDALQGTYAGTVSPFVKQTAGFTTGTGYYIKSLKTDSPSLAPKVLASPAMGAPPLYVQGLSVSAKSKKPALALSFAEFVTNNANQTAFVDIASGFLPGTTAAQSDPKFAKSDGTEAGDAQVIATTELPKAKNMTPPRWTAEMQTYFNQQMALALTGKTSAKAALDNAANKANTLLGK